MFYRYSHQTKQAEPIDEGNPWKLFQYLNVAKHDQLLVLVYIIACFIPNIPIPIFHPHGQQGSGKTTLCKIIKSLCDPSLVDAIITPKSREELIQVIAHHHVCIFDNMSKIPGWMSDILSQACTGAAFSKRRLFTNDDDVIYQVKRCIGLNGISLLIHNSDLMDRSILLHLDRIDPSERVDEAYFWTNFDKDKPEILGGILDALSKAIEIYPVISLEKLPRMADFAKWGCAITEALGINQREFLEAYQTNIKKQNEEIILNNTLAQAVISLMSDTQSWEGLMKDAWETLNDIADPNKHDRTFPKSERSLKRALDKIKTNLMDIGINFVQGNRTKDGIPIHFTRKVNFSTSNTLCTSTTINSINNEKRTMSNSNENSEVENNFSNLIDK